ncbi:hypothetical protein FGRMN_4154 [Fusarium graminum]|nr:hypothetical protein FGRMN_4154 [Fusarium graminum]
MALVSLPREILCEITSLDLSGQDLKSLRLTCHELGTVATPVLFYSIRISSLHRDRSNFFNIAKNFPHLVRVIVWEELNGYLSQLDDPPLNQLDADLAFFRDYISETRALFADTSLDIQCGCRVGFVNNFRDAVYRMPNLHTFASQPMSPRRELTLPGLGYTVTVEMINHLIKNEKRTALNNLGFLGYIIPTLIALAKLRSESQIMHPLPTITRLYYADEGFTPFTGLTQLEESDAIAFSTLCHLDLCMASVRCKGADLKGFKACLGQARNLTSLKLCQETCLEKLHCSAWDDTVPSFSHHNLLSLVPRFQSLTELHLVDIDLNRVDQTPAIVKLIGRHAQTLKRVYLISMHIEKSLIFQLAKNRELRLERFVVTSREDIDDSEDYDMDYDEDSDGWISVVKGKNISEEVALDFINRKSDSYDNQSLLPYDPKDSHTELHTHDAIFDIHTQQTAAICETRDNRWIERGYNPSDVQRLDFEMGDRRDEHGIAYDIGARRIKGPVTSLWIDSNGVFYNPVTDEEVEDPEARSYEPENDSWATQWQCTWDSDLGLWRNVENGNLRKFAIDRDASEIPQCQHEIDDIVGLAFGEDLNDTHAIRAQDEDEFFWFWQVSGTGGHATEVWHFEHKGEHAYGHEPLDFWHDWYENGSDSSRAEATPYGWNLFYFVTEAIDAGSAIPSGTCDSLSMYEPERDPMEEPFGRGTQSVLPFPADFEVHTKMKWTDVFFWIDEW